MNSLIGDLYNPTSSVLFLSICSLTKSRENRLEPYNKKWSITSRIKNEGVKKRLFQARSNSYRLHKEDDLKNYDQLIGQHPFNQDLKRGPEFLGNAKSPMLCAVERYVGRFFAGVKDDHTPYTIKDQCLRSIHHTLIISGLYGLLTPNEQIQLYESPLEDIQKIQEFWKKEDILTDILIEYITSQKISCLIDLTSQNAYQNLIRWPKVCSVDGLQVLHCYSSTGPGSDQLRDFGILMYDYLLKAKPEEIKALEGGETNHVKFKKNMCTPDEFPKEPTDSERIARQLISSFHALPRLEEPDYQTLFVKEDSRIVLEIIKNKNNPWELKWHPQFVKDINRYNDWNIRKRIIDAIAIITRRYPMNALKDTIKAMKLHKGFWRYREGDFRIFYYADEDSKSIVLLEFFKKKGWSEDYEFDQYPIDRLMKLIVE